MSRNTLCAIYLLIAISTVHSASYYYRAGREVIVPTIEEVKEVISELKKDGPVVIEEEVLLVQPTPETVDAAAPAVVAPEDLPIVLRSVPSVVETVVPIVENVETNNVVAAETVAVDDEARAKPSSNIGTLRLENIEVIQPDVKPEKVATVAETVKIAAVQAIEKQNEESVNSAVEIVKPVEVLTETKVEDTPVVKSIPVENAEPVAIKAPIEAVVPAVVESVEKVEKVQESMRSADPEPAKPEVVKDEKIEKPIEMVETEKIAEKAVEVPAEKPIEVPAEKPVEVPAAKPVEVPAEKSVELPAKEVRQQAAQPSPLDAIQTAISNLQNTVTNTFQNAIQNSKYFV